MQIISEWIKRKLQKYLPEDKSMDSALTYGINMAVYTFLSTMGLVILGFLLGKPLESLIIIAVCYTNQTIGGGHHANSHLKCFLTMVVSLTLGIVLSGLNMPASIMSSMGAIGCACLFLIPVVLHPKRFYLKGKLPYFTKRSRIVTIIESIILVVLILFHSSFYKVYVIGMLLSAISRVVAKFEH